MQYDKDYKLQGKRMPTLEDEIHLISLILSTSYEEKWTYSWTHGFGEERFTKIYERGEFEHLLERKKKALDEEE